MDRLQLSEETKVSQLTDGYDMASSDSPGQDRIMQVLNWSKVAVHWGYLPLILYLGLSHRRSEDCSSC